MSTAEAEYVSLSACCAQAIWMRTQLLDYGYRYMKIPMYCDSKSAIAISCNPVQHSRTKHINIQYHFIKEHVEQDIIEDYFVGTEYQLADLFSKALPKERCSRFYLQQFWKTVKQVPNANGTICFMIDRKEITYTVDMFRVTLKLPVKTLNNPFIEPADLKFIQRFLKIVGYEGIVDKVNAFYTKNLAQPWKTMFMVFNHCLTTRTSGHEQTKINILQIFHVVINCTHVDYATLLWNVTARGMLILDEFFIDHIRATEEYVKVFFRVDVPTIQSQPVESTQGTNRTLRSTRTPTPTTEVAQKKRKTKAVAGESSTPMKSLKVIIKLKKPSTTLIPPPSDDKERDEIAKATLLSLTMHKTAIAAEAQENVAKDEEDTTSTIEPKSHKEHPEIVDDDDDDVVDDVVDDKVEEKNNDEEEKKDDNDDDDNDDHALVRGKVSSCSKTRKEKMQTPNPPPPRSLRNDLSSDKTFSEELTVNVSPIPDTTSKDPSMSQPTSSIYKILPGSVAELSRRHDVILELVSKEFAIDAPKIIEELFKLHMKNKVLNVHPTVSISTVKTTADLKQQLYLKMKTDLQSQAANPEMWDILKKKFEKSSASASLGKVHDEHQGK
ncbi:hypothetical protein Tco_0614971 [Tanacetum coccineum]